MIRIGNFFFKYRNFLFIFLYLALFLPSAPVFTARMGHGYYFFPLVGGLLITITGQLIRGITIALAYIVRGGKDREVYADQLVVTGLFAHCRNPLYVGNILMLLGVGLMANSLLFLAVFMPLFLFIYQAIVLAEENFLRKKFGAQFDDYTSKVARWGINLVGLAKTISGMTFVWKRWLIKEYNTQVVWMTGIVVIIFWKYSPFFPIPGISKQTILVGCLLLLATYYLTVRFLKKSGKWANS